jgi:hypothetical protein
MVLQVVLTPPALLVMTDLRQRRLPDADEGRTAQMLGADLVDHHGPPRRWRRPLAAGRRATRKTFPKLGGEIEPLKVGKSIEVQLRCRSSDHGVEPPHSKEWHRLQFSEKRW